jgi:hypothetical protein
MWNRFFNHHFSIQKSKYEFIDGIRSSFYVENSLSTPKAKQCTDNSINNTIVSDIAHGKSPYGEIEIIIGILFGFWLFKKYNDRPSWNWKAFGWKFPTIENTEEERENQDKS